MAQNSQRKIRNFFIKKNLQGRIILAVFIAAVAGCFVVMGIFAIISSDSMTISYHNNSLQLGQTPLMLFKNALAANWFFILICGSLLVLATIIGTHRIAGPLFRLEKALDNMNRRNLNDTIFLRSKDEGKELADKINAFNLTLSQDLADLRRQTAVQNDLISRFEAMHESPPSQDDLLSLSQAMRNTHDKTKRILTAYRLVNE